MPKQTTNIQGQQTNSDKRRKRIFQDKPIDMTNKKWVRDTTAAVNTWKLKTTL